MIEIEFIYNDKPILPIKTALNELSEINKDMYYILRVLKEGHTIRKRENNVIEKCAVSNDKVINAVIVDMGNYYKLIHVGEFSFTKKFKRLLRDKNGF